MDQCLDINPKNAAEDPSMAPLRDRIKNKFEKYYAIISFLQGTWQRTKQLLKCWCWMLLIGGKIG